MEQLVDEYENETGKRFSEEQNRRKDTSVRGHQVRTGECFDGNYQTGNRERDCDNRYSQITDRGVAVSKNKETKMKTDLEEVVSELHHLSHLELMGHRFGVNAYTIDSREEELDEALVKITEEISVDAEGYTARIIVIKQ